MRSSIDLGTHSSLFKACFYHARYLFRAENFRMVDIGINWLNPLFFLISRLNIACSPLIFNLQINYPIRIKDI